MDGTLSRRTAVRAPLGLKKDLHDWRVKGITRLSGIVLGFSFLFLQTVFITI